MWECVKAQEAPSTSSRGPRIIMAYDLDWESSKHQLGMRGMYSVTALHSPITSGPWAVKNEIQTKSVVYADWLNGSRRAALLL